MHKIQQFILREKRIFVGLEDSKRSWKLCVRSEGCIVHQTSMPADYEVLRNYFRNKFPGCVISVMYEAGFRGYGLYDKLVADGWKCVVTPPHTVTEEKCNRLKNDRIDCRRLATNLENRDYKVCRVPPKQEREDRQINRVYDQLQKDITRVCNRIRRMLEFHGLDEQFSPGRWSKTQYDILAVKLESMDLSESLRFSFEMLLRQLSSLREMHRTTLRQLQALGKSPAYEKQVRILTSAPGIGPLTAIRLVMEWGSEMSRFKSKESFANYTGLIPSDRSTGDRDRRGHITKQGNQNVRSWLIESAWVAIRYDPVLAAKYQAVAHNSGSKKKAIVAVARKLAIRLRAILLTEELYCLGSIQA